MSKNIMVIEDDLPIRESLVELLAQEGYEVSSFDNGQEALDYLRAEAARLPDLILLDLMMPVLDGAQFIQRQSSDPRLAHIPVVVMSARGQLQERHGELQARAYIKKPMGIDQVLATVSRQL